jgi:hypothetical protein
MTLGTLHMWTAILLIYMVYNVGHYVDFFVDLHDV